jgi:transcriptional regulator with XRE-family HTH domain
MQAGYSCAMDEQNALGDYLRARRELVRPQDVGIRIGGIRRVVGLRREEVAMLAGVSSDYYLRLEQGRDRHPSVKVLEALSRVLQLDDSATDHLVSLTQERPRTAAKWRIREVVPGWHPPARARKALPPQGKAGDRRHGWPASRGPPHRTRFRDSGPARADGVAWRAYGARQGRSARTRP